MRPMTLALSLTGLLAGPVLAQDNVVIDYRDEAVLDFADTEQWSPIAEKLGDGLTVLGEVSGSFTKSGADEVAYLVSKGRPAANDPFLQVTQHLAIFAGDEQVGDLMLPDNAAYTRAVRAVDVNGDGVSEVVLEGSFYNMGTSAIGLDVIRIGETPEVIQTLPEVYLNSCDAGIGEKTISASLVRVGDGELVAKAAKQACS